MRRLASHVSRSKRADKRWTTTTRPTPLNYESFSNEATLPLFLARSLSLSLALPRPRHVRSLPFSSLAEFTLSSRDYTPLY